MSSSNIWVVISSVIKMVLSDALMLTYFTFIEGGYKIETVKQSDGTDILFKDILLHFRNVEHKINAPAFNIGQAAADHGHKSTNMTPPKTTSILGVENTNSGNQIPPVTTSGFTVCETTTQVISINSYSNIQLFINS